MTRRGRRAGPGGRRRVTARPWRTRTDGPHLLPTPFQGVASPMLHQYDQLHPQRPEQDAELAAIVRASAAGDQAAFERLVARFDRLLRGVTRSFRLTSWDADDVIQSTWLQFLQHGLHAARARRGQRLARDHGAPPEPEAAAAARPRAPHRRRRARRVRGRRRARRAAPRRRAARAAARRAGRAPDPPRAPDAGAGDAAGASATRTSGACSRCRSAASARPLPLASRLRRSTKLQALHAAGV